MIVNTRHKEIRNQIRLKPFDLKFILTHSIIVVVWQVSGTSKLSLKLMLLDNNIDFLDEK